MAPVPEITHIPPPAADGKLPIVVTYLEMLGAPKRLPAPAPARKLALLQAEKMPVHFYRYLYNTVGEPWLWYERRALDDAMLAEAIHDPRVEIYVLYVAGSPAGYAELDRRRDAEIELAYFGLIPDFIGQGLGTYLLNWTVDTAWRHGPKRLWVHTCNLDHPRALQTYQRAGFVAYKQDKRVIDDPRLSGLMGSPVTPRP
ncbi:MAG TPA: GNAT family N-acetyltransferase [Alphaproteobacteria bacterium]|nr:GNAT family N-acetyltransferase [Alphaproteobacteria bacterium]